jgi:AraC family transcriptional regulator
LLRIATEEIDAMHYPSLLKARQDLGREPILEGRVGGPIPLFVERYIYQAKAVASSGIPCICLATQFGGRMVREGEDSQTRSTSLPSQSLLIPPNMPTHWHYTGTVDYALLYIFDTSDPLAEALLALAQSRTEPLRFSDALVGTACRQLLDEMHKGFSADQSYMQLLVRVIFEQTFRTLTSPATGGINPRHAQFSRLQAVLNFIRGNLASDLSVSILAGVAGVSVSYFRQIFQDATNMAPHDFVQAARLEQARGLLTHSALPIAQIAEDCGFANQSHLTARFRAAYALTPAQFRKRFETNS